MSETTAVILVDPLNDFVHPKGKLYPFVQESIETTDTVTNMARLVKSAREMHIPIFYGLHQPYKEGNYDGWRNMTKSHHRLKKLEAFKEGTWGSEIQSEMTPSLGNGDVVVSRHWNSSSFANTDLDFQLQQRGITHVVCAGMVANTCLEATARYAFELGYKVTLIKDATAGFSTQLKDAATEIVWPTIVEEVLTVDEWAAKGKTAASL
ncbi:hypothetical protein ASPWEDRAFT_32947 [Aspergillus wentii DTO 134E9]|uniref:Isochorismatase-like domain-containing protein n=1 Tax=Aspergillus wentii DTO 134E9 TaxID=1073089 RepID=A0A1L9R463_ASPWE|nr:uncharacterized protein ASPWEDRAFT_32947 [Aspergillus wentii DTO 134E9]KAI9926992.1 hypothetical protein MW887_003373 [Aspergillus wentii]OJJ29706.1 hypothetical protein ASPWEDRAFT_32947 [Aspergillus wentii DTO 134E9]